MAASHSGFGERMAKGHSEFGERMAKGHSEFGERMAKGKSSPPINKKSSLQNQKGAFCIFELLLFELDLFNFTAGERHALFTGFTRGCTLDFVSSCGDFNFLRR